MPTNLVDEKRTWIRWGFRLFEKLGVEKNEAEVIHSVFLLLHVLITFLLRRKKVLVESTKRICVAGCVIRWWRIRVWYLYASTGGREGQVQKVHFSLSRIGRTINVGLLNFPVTFLLSWTGKTYSNSDLSPVCHDLLSQSIYLVFLPVGLGRPTFMPILP